MVERPAGFWIRVGARILDSIFITFVFFIVFLIIPISGSEVEVFPEITQNDLIVNSIQGIGELLYGLIVPVIWVGYTVGKRICGIRIVKVDGSNVGFGTMLIRVVVGGFVYVITLGIAFIVSVFMVAFRKDKRSIHDMLARTYVTYNKPTEDSPYQQ